MHDSEKSDSAIVAVKSPNNAGPPAAEAVEPRAGTKGNADRPMQHVATADDPWLAELGRAFGDLEGKVATADVWKVLKLSPYARTMEEHLRLTAVMRLLGWDRRLLRFRGGQVGRGFVRGTDGRTIYVFICPIKGEVYYVGYDTAPSAGALGY